MRDYVVCGLGCGRDAWKDCPVLTASVGTWARHSSSICSHERIHDRASIVSQATAVEEPSLSDDKRGPATIIFASGEQWSDLRVAVLQTLARPRPESAPLRTRVRVGSVLTDTSTVSRMTYGEHKAGVGRGLQRRTERPKMLVELERDARLTAALTMVTKPREATPRRPGAWANFRILGWDALSFSSIDSRTLQALVDLPQFRSRVIAAGHFDPTDWVQFHLLWTCLLPHAIVTDGRILEAIEEEPTFLDDWTTLTDIGGLTFGHGAFYELMDLVYVDELAADCAIPLPLAGPKAIPLENDTPVALAMSHAGLVTGPRISTQDQADAHATVSRSFAFYEYPDPNVLERKVRDFLLNPRHSKARWRDFADCGYLDQGDGALVLASTLASVLHGPFLPLDARPTADAALQFSVAVLLSSAQIALPLTTSWVYRDGPPPTSTDLDDLGSPTADHGLWLATAHVDRKHDEYALPRVAPFDPITRDWNDLISFVEAEARSACTALAVDAASTAGFLWVPRGSGRQNEFFNWIRTNRRAQTYWRRAYGGPVLLYSLNSLGRHEGETGVSAAIRLAQALLGMVGLRSYVSLHFD